MNDQQPLRHVADDATRTVAFFGLGNLGGPIADALIASRHSVKVFDPIEAAMAARVERGARRATSAADAAHDADVAIVIVRDDAQVLDLLSENGALPGLRSGTVVALHSTVAPHTVRVVAERCAHVGVRFVDTGITTGGGRPIGDLLLMCGGDPDAIAYARPVFDVYCSEVVRFGEIGAGMRAKLIRNAMRYAQYAVVYEGMALAEAAGLDLAAMAHLYRSTFGTTRDDDVVLDRMSMHPTDPDDASVDERFRTQMTAATTLGWKDLDDAFELAAELGGELPMARAARPLLGPSFGVDVRP
jgi:3-hydroxyisobutyrate dehydrogenase-like beta-hydroxyacid dehydrogenase